MSKELPLLPGFYYHIYNRGNNGENLFIEPRNYDYFLKLYGHHIYPIAETYAYCLMKNHFHLLVRIRPEPDLPGFKNLAGLDYSKAFSNLFNAYSKAINNAYQRTGSLFEKPFKRIVVDSDSYFVQLVNYIHHNPQKHGFTVDFRTYPHSSYRTIIKQKVTRLEVNRVLEWFGSHDTFIKLSECLDENSIKHLLVE
jgi:putative transposase